jgi:drug/metabolite transporter (DMT)-like permease
MANNDSQRPGFLPVINSPIRGALWMMSAGLMLTIMSALMRNISADLHPFQIAFFRSLFGFLFMVPWLFGSGLAVLQTARFGLHLTRGMIAFVGLLMWTSALALIPVASVTAFSFTAPLFATFGSALILREVVRARRWIAVGAGFIGMLIMLRPGIAALQPGALLAVSTAVCIAASMLIVKRLSATERPGAVVAYMALFLTVFTAVPALFVWQEFGWIVFGKCVAMGGFGTLGHLCMVRAFAAADASAVAPFDYARLPFAALIGFVMFAETPDVWTWIGSAVIAASAIYIAQREAANRKKADVSVQREAAAANL